MKITVVIGIIVGLAVGGAIYLFNSTISDAQIGAPFRVTRVTQGGTSTSTVPALGEILVGQPDGSYAPQATSTLGLGGGGGSGTVTSVAQTVPTGWTVSGSPITTSGTLALDYDTGFAAVLTASTTNWNNFFDSPQTVITAGTGIDWTTNTLNVTLGDFDTDDLSQGSSNLYNQTHTGEVTGATALTIANNVVDEANLLINTPTDNFLMMASSSAAGGFEWIATSSPLLNLGTGGGGGGSGTVGAGTTGQFPYYAANGTTLTATSTFFLATNGFLGINNILPNDRLHITEAASSTAVEPILRLQQLSDDSSDQAGVGVQFKVDSTTGDERWKAALNYIRTESFGRGKLAFLLQNSGNTDNVDAQNWQDDAKLVVNNDGQIGINQAAPEDDANFNEELVIFESNGNSSDTCIGLSNDADKYWLCIESGNDNFAIGTGVSAGTNDVLSITTAGLVGIGDETPSAKLTVQGDAGSTNPFVVASSTGTELLTVTSAGRVGIGASSPLGNLHINETSASAHTTFYFESSGGSTPETWVWFLNRNTGRLNYQNVGTGNVAIIMDPTARNNGLVVIGDNVGIGAVAPTANLFVQSVAGQSTDIFAVASSTGTNFLTVTSDGNVGIGTNAPANKLDVNNTNGSVAALNISSPANVSSIEFSSEGGGTSLQGEVWSSVGAGNSPFFSYKRSRGTEAIPEPLKSGDTIGTFRFFGAHTTSTVTSRQLDFGVSAAENWSSSAKGTNFFVDGTNLGATARTNWLTIVDGNVGIGTTTPSSKLTINETTNAHINLDGDSGNASPDEGDFWRESDGLKYFDGTDEHNLLRNGGLTQATGNNSSASCDDVAYDMSWSTTAMASADVSISGADITIDTTGVYKFTVTSRTVSNNRTELFINTFIDTGSGYVQDTDAIISNYVARDSDQDTGGITLSYAFDLDATDQIKFETFGDTDGTCVALDPGTVLIVENF